jgi:HAT1-interacting factor 1
LKWWSELLRCATSKQKYNPWAWNFFFANYINLTEPIYHLPSTAIMADGEPTANMAPEDNMPDGLGAKLDQLKAEATQQYSLKNYSAAAEFYSEAAEVQDQVNGEMSLDNADVLYQYGRCLYHLAVSQSDVLGGKVASQEEPKRKKRKVSKKSDNAGEGSSSLISDAIKSGEQKLAEDVVEAAVENKDSIKREDDNINKPYFQITGDENWTDSEDSDAADGEDGENGDAEEEDDDFQTAYEILDMARVLLTRKIARLEESTAVPKNSPELRILRERLADTHDLQAEISLENERFTDAISDTRDALILKQTLYPIESSLVAEAHFKLSLALEFASVTSTSENADGGETVAEVNEEMRGEAALEMEKAIASCKVRIAKEEAGLAEQKDEAKAKDTRASIQDVKEMVGDMEQRLEDLRKPAKSLSALQNGALGPMGGEGDAALQGVLGAMLGESKADAQKRLKDATAKANDLTGLVKKKKKEKKVEQPVVEGKGKRKAIDEVDATEGLDAPSGNGKKVKFEEVGVRPVPEPKDGI